MPNARAVLTNGATAWCAPHVRSTHAVRTRALRARSAHRARTHAKHARATYGAKTIPKAHCARSRCARGVRTRGAHVQCTCLVWTADAALTCALPERRNRAVRQKPAHNAEVHVRNAPVPGECAPQMRVERAHRVCAPCGHYEYERACVPREPTARAHRACTHRANGENTKSVSRRVNREARGIHIRTPVR